MKKNEVKIPNKNRDLIIPFAKILSLGVITIGAISMLTSPVLGITYILGIAEMGLGLIGGVYCATVDHLEHVRVKKESKAVREMVIKEYAQEKSQEQNRVISSEYVNKKEQNTEREA